MKHSNHTHYVSVILKVVRNHIDRFAKVVEGNCISYTTRQQPKVPQFLDSRKVEQMFIDLYGPLGQHAARSAADLKSIKQHKQGNKSRSISSLKSLYQNN
jgi:hypothetical protein